MKRLIDPIRSIRTIHTPEIGMIAQWKAIVLGAGTVQGIIRSNVTPTSRFICSEGDIHGIVI
jgi:hypothetical protein